MVEANYAQPARLFSSASPFQVIQPGLKWKSARQDDEFTNDLGETHATSRVFLEGTCVATEDMMWEWLRAAGEAAGVVRVTDITFRGSDDIYLEWVSDEIAALEASLSDETRAEILEVMDKVSQMSDDEKALLDAPDDLSQRGHGET
ncbi:MAG TPA: hypothetical protein VIM33_09090 [Gaiellaceae bacterium]|jgi:hypothetical protein